MIWLLRGRGSKFALYCDTNKQRWFFLKQGLKFEFAMPYCSPCVNLTNSRIMFIAWYFSNFALSDLHVLYIFVLHILYFHHVFIGTCFWYAVVYLVCFVLCFFITLALYGAVTSQHGWLCLITPMPKCYLITVADNAPFCHLVVPVHMYKSTICILIIQFYNSNSGTFFKVNVLC